MGSWFKALLLILLFMAVPLYGSAQELEKGTEEAAEEVAEEVAEEEKELNFAGTPYVYTGPDTGFGFGFSIMFRDLFGKEGRDATFSASYTQTQYLNLGVDWGEPYFLSDRGRLKLRVGYDNKPAIRFYGFGNDTRRSDRSNWSWTQYEFAPKYIYRFPKTKAGIMGLRVGLAYNNIAPEDGQLQGDSEDLYFREISQVHPEVFNSFHFNDVDLIGVNLTFYLDNREDRFPLGGGREEVVWPMKGTYSEIYYERFDEAVGSDVSYQKASIDLRQVFPLYFEDTILVLREKVIVSQGEVPFYKMPNYGGGNDLRGYYSYRFVDENATQFNVELRQGLLPDKELVLFDGLIKLKYPSIFIYWEEGRVYEDIEDIPEEWLEDYHWTYGYGFRFIVTPTVVIRFEYGFSDEQATFLMNAGLPF